MKILGVDPGREKTGLALIDASGALLWRKIIAPAALETEILAIFKDHAPEKIALGDSTASHSAKIQIETALAKISAPVALQIVDETASTLEARALYWRAHPPRGLKKWIPLSLQVPPAAVDDFAAAVIALRAL